MTQAMFDITRISNGNLLDLAPIVEGASVSKPLVNSRTLRQIVFAMDRGQVISEHQAPFLAIVQVLDGRLRFGVGGETHELGPHDWLLMPPDAPHDLTALEPTRFLLTLGKEPTE